MTLILIALKLILVVILSANISRMSYGAAFFVAALVFGIMAVYGRTTKRDLSSIGSIGFMALIGIIVASLINLLLKSDAVSYVISYITVSVFIT
ncbi:MAG TPA: Bax inhibitor-1 family protein, partial [Candidatus Bathyarchaeia archaeon]|nr:Bax inhibitor-1 family protein [Candidatus Bathyarchaeia archaeon]